MAWVLLGASILVFWQIARIGHRDGTVKTMEGVLARGLQFLPLAILFGRTVWFYTAGAFLFTAMSAAVFLLLRQITLELNTRW
ncbi:hypothetical protein [Nitrosococcus oceani]|uniref:hypothetical protein n=1 Tax=Nitrosococcus oceani TaxID=1229 RepID=UPI0004E8FD2B|nr:hypothetical protein [Nitrosococcus oceani]KFI22763.1 hypothetical protein HW44_07810 [Nitrosococcus oceani]